MTVSAHCIEPPPHLLKQWVQAAREAEKKGGPYAKTFAMAAIDWALNSQPTPNNLQIRSLEIIPPPELVAQWFLSAKAMPVDQWVTDVATQAARWGSDQELEACCEWLANARNHTLTWNEATNYSANLLHARRPKPPSLKEQALKELKDWTNEKHGPGGEVLLCEGLSVAIIREALESLPD